MASKSASTVHWMVRLNWRKRTLSCVLLLACVTAHFLDVGASALVWCIVGFQFLVYPQLVYWRARLAADQKAAELQNHIVDAVLFGVWAAALGFPVWITFIFVVTSIINMTVYRGRSGFFESFVWMAVGVGLSLAVGGFHFRPETGWSATLLCIASIMAYVLVIAESVYERSVKLYQTREQLRESQQELLRQLAENNRLQEQLRDQANHDPLTGLYNRRYLDDTLPRELNRCARESLPVSIAIIDIDHFKRVNDTYGHFAGDCVLKHLAHRLGSEVRVSDVACRFGGEEFLLLLPGMGQDVALERANAWRTAFASSHIQFEGISISATLSIGIATFQLHGTTPEDLCQAADKALYIAKAQGRNRVVAAQPIEQSVGEPSIA